MKKPVTHADFFVEIGCEEIPAWMIRTACHELKVLLEKYLGAAAILENQVAEAYGAPRRLIASIPSLLLKQADVVKEVVGPNKAVAYDHEGNPTRAALGFAAKFGVPPEELFIVQSPKGECVAARQAVPGRSSRQVLEEILPRVIQEIPWPKNMRWTELNGPRFIRPVRWMVALLGGRAVPFEFGGVRAGDRTSGHRFLGKENIQVSSRADHTAKLRRNFVLTDPAERRAKIEHELQDVAGKKGLHIHEDARLLELVTYLNEYPSVILGDFDAKSLELPQEILLTVMRGHQKYFGVERKAGQLAPHFAAVINLDRDRGGQIRRGHERVLRARFADARFFWETDLKCRLADNLPKLAEVVYESKLGSYAVKVERLRDLAGGLAREWRTAGADASAVDRAALLAKCDLVTGMVREFTELQGIVGGLYARAQGEPEEVAAAIYDHYLPLGLEDRIPGNLTGCCVAAADKLDALVGCFAAGRIPSGSSDPFALRRAATGLVKILFERRLPLSLSGAVAAAAKSLRKHNPGVKVSAEVEKQVVEFVLDRARHVLQQRLGYAYDEIKATLAAGADDLVDALDRLAAVKAMRRTPNFEPLAVAFKRIRNIVDKAGPEKSWKVAQVDPGRFTVEAERALHAAAQEVAVRAAELKRRRHYWEALERISSLRPTVDEFFDKVLVMAEEEEVRKNRLTMLAELLREFSTIADFSEIVTEATDAGGKRK
jgi:glycyl-tRNA synthetase beta chain